MTTKIKSIKIKWVKPSPEKLDGVIEAYKTLLTDKSFKKKGYIKGYDRSTVAKPELSWGDLRMIADALSEYYKSPTAKQFTVEGLKKIEYLRQKIHRQVTAYIFGMGYAGDATLK